MHSSLININDWSGNMIECTVKTIIKRDGRIKEFDSERIKLAITGAIKECDNILGVSIESLAGAYEEEIVSMLNCLGKEQMTVEEIQDVVEEVLKKDSNHIYERYHNYRVKRTKERESNAKFYLDIKSIFDQTSEEVKNNANKAGDKLYTYRAMISDVACNNYADMYIIPEDIMKEHQKSIYIHDKSYLPIPLFNCILVDWMDMLKNGFTMGGTKISSPNSVTTAIAILSQIVSHTTSASYGGNTLGDLDIGLEPYIKKSYEKHLKIAKEFVSEDRIEEYADKMTEKEVYNAVQGFEYEITTLMNSRGEVPFETISFGRSTSKWGRMFQKAYLETRYKGFTDGTTPVFPKICFFLQEGLNLNPTDVNYDMFKLAVKCSSVRMYPDYLNIDKLIENTGDVKTPMGCRSFLSTYKDKDGNIKTYGRFNQGVCSINLPRLAIQAQGDEKKFYSLLDEALEKSRKVLMIRHNMLKTVKAKQNPIMFTEGAVARLNPEDSIEPLLLNNYSSISIGYVGLWNCMIALYGKAYDQDNMMSKGEAILQYLRDYCDNLKKETTIGFSLYSTPAETLATKFCKADIDEFGIIEGVNDLGYYHNSFHYPAEQDITPFDKIDLESHFPKIASGGAINYVQFGNMETNLEALEEIIRYASTKVHYFGVNTRPDRCLACDYKGMISPKHEDGYDYVCPNCGNEDRNKMSIVIRICGYLGSLSQRPTIDGKMKEMNTRVTHMGEMQ